MTDWSDITATESVDDLDVVFATEGQAEARFIIEFNALPQGEAEARLRNDPGLAQQLFDDIGGVLGLYVSDRIEAGVPQPDVARWMLSQIRTLITMPGLRGIVYSGRLIELAIMAMSPFAHVGEALDEVLMDEAEAVVAECQQRFADLPPDMTLALRSSNSDDIREARRCRQLWASASPDQQWALLEEALIQNDPLISAVRVTMRNRHMVAVTIVPCAVAVEDWCEQNGVRPGSSGLLASPAVQRRLRELVGASISVNVVDSLEKIQALDVPGVSL